MNERIHTIFRSVMVAVGVFLSIYIAVPDYPYGVPLWQSLTMDANGFWHELWYVWGLVLAAVFIDVVYQLIVSLREAIDTVKAFLRVFLYEYDPSTHKLTRVRKMAKRPDDAHLGVPRASGAHNPVVHDRKSDPPA